jgi:hypothetical protein
MPFFPPFFMVSGSVKIIEIMELRILHDYFIESTSIVIPEQCS